MSMLNPPERQQYLRAGLVKGAAKVLKDIFGSETPSEKAIKKEMDAIHNHMQKRPTGVTKKEAIKITADKFNISPTAVRNVEKVYDYQAGGGGKENLFGEIKQTYRALTTKPTAGQADAEDFGGAPLTREARRSKGKAVLKTAGAGVLGGIGAYFKGLSDSQQTKVKENKSGSVTDITSGTMDAAFSKASKNPSTYVFMKSGMPHFKYKGKAIPFSLATEEEDVVLDMTPREKKNEGSKVEKEKSLLREIGKAYASIPKEASKATKRMAKNFYEDVVKEAPDMIKEIPGAVANIKQVKNVAKMIKDPLNLGDMMKVPEKVGGGKSKSRARRAEGGSKFPDLTGDGKITQADILKGRGVFQEGGMPVDTYPNIPPEEMEEALASQLPDDEMEENYIKFVMDESLDDSEQDYLAEALTKDERLSDILDKVITTASEFSGAGEVEGPGTGVSDSVPARLSDGEFVFTKKATDQLGADNLQRMMDDAERAYDGGLQQLNVGGMPRQEEEEELEKGRFDMSKTDEEIKKLMIGANKMPSVQ